MSGERRFKKSDQLDVKHTDSQVFLSLLTCGACVAGCVAAPCSAAWRRMVPHGNAPQPQRDRTATVPYAQRVYTCTLIAYVHTTATQKLRTP